MKFAPIIMLAMVLLVTGCKKKSPAPAPQSSFTVSQYFPPLKVGNYWAYQRVDTGYNQTFNDTIKIVSDSVINSLTYYYITGGVFEGIVEGYYADSAGKIVMWQDTYPYALSNKTNDTLSYNLVGTDTIIERTGNIDTLINVTAGAFNNTIQLITDTYYAGETARPIHKYLYFSKGVGVVYGTFSFPDRPTQVITMQLVGYHITS